MQNAHFCLQHCLAVSKGQSPWKTDRCLAVQEKFRPLWNWKVRHRHVGPPLDPITSQLNPLPIFFEVYCRSKMVDLTLCIASGPHVSGFPIKISHIWTFSRNVTLRSLVDRSRCFRRTVTAVIFRTEHAHSWAGWYLSKEITRRRI
jgi:hypothetical protein